jgi:hypothetical protein
MFMNLLSMNARDGHDCPLLDKLCQSTWTITASIRTCFDDVGMLAGGNNAD